MLSLREGDFLEIKDGAIFEVKGLVHPPDRTIAFPRYIPDSKGERERRGVRYRKITSLAERYETLKERYPHLIRWDPVFSDHTPQIDSFRILHSYLPQSKLDELRNKNQPDDFERETISLVELLRETSNIAWRGMGVTGSVLVGLHTDASDIDIIVYGRKNCSKVHEALQHLFTSSPKTISQYKAKEDLMRLYRLRARDTKMPFKEFAWHEGRKRLQGTYRGRDFFIRCVKDWEDATERYGDILYKPEGYVKAKARIVDASESIFTPCSYKVANVKVMKGRGRFKVREIASFRGRFCEQAENGETMLVQGKLEGVTTPQEEYHRVLLGTNVRDFMITVKA